MRSALCGRAFGNSRVPLGCEQKLDRLAYRIDRAAQVLVLTFNLYMFRTYEALVDGLQMKLFFSSGA